jgi:hypothetical protein
MNVTFIVQLEIPESLLSKLATYSFIDSKEWIRYGNTSMQLPEKHAKFLNNIFCRKLKSLNPNISREILE